VVGIHLPVEEVNAGDLHRFNNGIDFGWVAAFRKIGDTFDESAGHAKRITTHGSTRQPSVGGVSESR